MQSYKIKLTPCWNEVTTENFGERICNHESHQHTGGKDIREHKGWQACVGIKEEEAWGGISEHEGGQRGVREWYSGGWRHW